MVYAMCLAVYHSETSIVIFKIFMFGFLLQRRVVSQGIYIDDLK